MLYIYTTYIYAASVLVLCGELQPIDGTRVHRTNTSIEEPYEVLLPHGLAAGGAYGLVAQGFVDAGLPEGVPALRNHNPVNAL